MGLLEDPSDDLLKKHQELCCNLNLDTESQNQAWTSYESIRQNYTLEGEQLHWLGCAVYVACRKVTTPSVGHSDTIVTGNCVNLTRLLRSCNLSLIQFFVKSKQWIEMANMPAEFRTEIERLERNFEVSMVLFRKYQPIFFDMFSNSAEDCSKQQQRSRKQKSLPCTSTKLFEFCWTLFVYVKSQLPDISIDLVNSYHYLLACCDLMYANIIMSDRRSLINLKFKGLPENFASEEYTPPSKPPCVINTLCNTHDGIVVEAKTIKEYHWKPQILKLFEEKILGCYVRNLSGILDQGRFDSNFKAVNKAYETYVLSKGDFDERIFLEDGANNYIGSPTKTIDITEQLQAKRSRNSEYETGNQHLVVSTPLTGRRYLWGRDHHGATPVSIATHSVAHLHTLLSGRTAAPSSTLIAIFKSCTTDPKERIESRIKELGSIFCTKYSSSTGSTSDSPNRMIDFSQKRLELAKTLYYKLLEDILLDEKKKKQNPNLDLTALLENEVFHPCLFACCLEIVIYSYKSQKKFPWVIEALNLSAYYFYKVIEPIVSIKDHLARDVVKHLNLIEEQILQAMAWSYDSPLWEEIVKSGLSVPRCGDVTLPGHLQPPPSNDTSDQNGGSTQSPGSSAVERFQSPISNEVKKSFQDSNHNLKQGQSMLLVAKDGQQRIIPVVIPLVIQQSQSSLQQDKLREKKTKRGGSLALFFRKFYHLASVRMQDLCNKLNVNDQELKQKIWTCFEHSIVEHTNLMKDRHLDQILMCAVYAVCKILGTELKFAQIMASYRSQPQAESGVYRSVLLGFTTKQNNINKGNNDQSIENVDRTVKSQPTFVQTRYLEDGTLLSEVRENLIEFYNIIYVENIKNFVLKFSTRQGQCEELPLSPLPIRLLLSSPIRRITDTVSIKALNNQKLPSSPTPSEPNTYIFSRSPAKDLDAINHMIYEMSYKKVGKRLLTDNPIDEGAPAPKQTAPVVTRRLRCLIGDRLMQSQD